MTLSFILLRLAGVELALSLVSFVSGCALTCAVLCLIFERNKAKRHSTSRNFVAKFTPQESEAKVIEFLRTRKKGA